ncbi:MAG: hypothetical protein ACP5T5_01265 [Thermoprotei archaeon]|nr:hypothetical protein [TACK group archaeon]
MEELGDLVKRLGKPYSELLGIDLKSGDEREIFKWFLASLLFAKPIREETAIRTYRSLETEGLVDPDSLLAAGWAKLVEALDRGGYVRYDFSTATKILEATKNLKERYGTLSALHEKSTDENDLEQRIKGLAKGIGDVTVSIFLRDMKITWRDVREKPTPLLKAGMEAYGIEDCDAAAGQLGVDPVMLKTALSRFAKENKRKMKITLNTS